MEDETKYGNQKEQILNTDKQDSIKIVKTSKSYNWEIKTYFNSDVIKPIDIIKNLKIIDKELRTSFGVDV